MIRVFIFSGRLGSIERFDSDCAHVANPIERSPIASLLRLGAFLYMHLLIGAAGKNETLGNL